VRSTNDPSDPAEPLYPPYLATMIRSTPLLLVVAALLGSTAQADTIVVTQVRDSFSPKNVTIDEGDTVMWVWTNGFHTVTEGTDGQINGDEAFNAPLSGIGGATSFSLTFDAAFLAANPRPGDLYDYFCEPHFAVGQTGTVQVVNTGGGGPQPYCTPKTSSAGCVARIGTSSPSMPVSGAGDYSLTASNVQGFKNGLAFVSLSGSANLPFNGGTLCITPPTKRGPIMNSVGTGSVACDGTYSTLVNDGQIVPAGLDAGPGNSGWYQYWYRDPQNGAGNAGTALSDAIQLDFQ